LNRTPEEALRAGAAAQALFKERAAPFVLQARALVALRRYAEAYEHFERAERLSPSGLEAPDALHDFAIAARKTRHASVALASYRALVPRAALLGQSLRRHQMYVEAAATAMASGTGGLDEALGYLTEARRQPAPAGFSDFVVAMLSLSLDRQGRRHEAQGVASELGGPDHLARFAPPAGAGGDATPPKRPELPASSLAPMLTPGEWHALVAVAAQVSDPALAAEHWKAYLATVAAQDPWLSHAKAELDALARRGFR
jgi:tetratricopeptide (TPR) repeat protein